MPAPTPKLLAPYREKDPSDKHVRMAKWIKANGGGEIDPKAIQVVLAADGKFQKSEENQGFLKNRRVEIEREKQAREERAQQRAERAEAKQAAQAEKAEKAATKKAASPKSDTPPTKKAASPAKTAPASKKATGATPNKTAARKPTSKAKATAGASEFDSDDF